MEICFILNGQKVCFTVPLLINWDPIHPDPGPESLLRDISLVATVNAMAGSFASESASRALMDGVNGAVKELENGFGKGVEIHNAR